jgi:hypothetical protein
MLARTFDKPDHEKQSLSSWLLMLVFVLAISLFAMPAFADDDDDDDDDDGPSGPAFVIITDLDDMDLGTWTGASELSDESKHCVAATDKDFSIVATGSGVGGAFSVTNGAAEIPFQVYYKEKKNADRIQLTAGSASYNFKGNKIKKKSPYCKNGKQIVEVRMQGADMAKVPAGAYSGTLSLVVSPQ